MAEMKGLLLINLQRKALIVPYLSSPGLLRVVARRLDVLASLTCVRIYITHPADLVVKLRWYRWLPAQLDLWAVQSISNYKL